MENNLPPNESETLCFKELYSHNMAIHKINEHEKNKKPLNCEIAPSPWWMSDSVAKCVSLHQWSHTLKKISTLWPTVKNSDKLKSLVIWHDHSVSFLWIWLFKYSIISILTLKVSLFTLANTDGLIKYVWYTYFSSHQCFRL